MTKIVVDPKSPPDELSSHARRLIAASQLDPHMQVTREQFGELLVGALNARENSQYRIGGETGFDIGMLTQRLIGAELGDKEITQALQSYRDDLPNVVATTQAKTEELEQLLFSYATKISPVVHYTNNIACGSDNNVHRFRDRAKNLEKHALFVERNREKLLDPGHVWFAVHGANRGYDLSITHEYYDLDQGVTESGNLSRDTDKWSMNYTRRSVLRFTVFPTTLQKAGKVIGRLAGRGYRTVHIYPGSKDPEKFVTWCAEQLPREAPLQIAIAYAKDMLDQAVYDANQKMKAVNFVQ